MSSRSSIIPGATTNLAQSSIRVQCESSNPSTLLGALLVQFTKPRVDVRLDYENLHISLRNLGWRPDAKALIVTVKKVAQHLGIVSRIVAYADWDLLSISDKKTAWFKLA